ncbi:MAG: hypothetical protein IH953_02810 [Chloroflexi bacterium]|nr:hypothetical protein [Chloroflexota bacterium]
MKSIHSVCPNPDCPLRVHITPGFRGGVIETEGGPVGYESVTCLCGTNITMQMLDDGLLEICEPPSYPSYKSEIPWLWRLWMRLRGYKLAPTFLYVGKCEGCGRPWLDAHLHQDQRTGKPIAYDQGPGYCEVCGCLLAKSLP